LVMPRISSTGGRASAVACGRSAVMSAMCEALPGKV